MYVYSSDVVKAKAFKAEARTIGVKANVKVRCDSHT